MSNRQNPICFFIIEGVPGRRVRVYDNEGIPLGNVLGDRTELPVKNDIVPYYYKDDKVLRYARVEDRVFYFTTDEYQSRVCNIDIILRLARIPAEYVEK